MRRDKIVVIHHKLPYIVAIWKGPRLITHKVVWADDEKDALTQARQSYEAQRDHEFGVSYHPKLSDPESESPKTKGKRPKFRLTPD